MVRARTTEELWGKESRITAEPKLRTTEEVWGDEPQTTEKLWGKTPPPSIEEPTPRVEHLMPSGEVMPGTEHPGAVPGTTRPSPLARAKEIELPGWFETMAKEQRKSFTDPTGLDRQMIASTAYAGAGIVKGLSLGYIDPRTGEVTIPLTRKTSKKFKGIEEIPYLAEADVYKPIAYGAGHVAGALAPISRIYRATSWMMKGKNIPVVLRAGKAVGVGRPLVRPALQRLVEAGVAGATYGVLEKPPEKVSRAKNALDMSAWFMTFTGGTMAVDKAVRSLGLGKVRAYQNFRRDMIRIFRKNGYPEKEAQVASDILINKGMTNVYGKEWPKKVPAVKFHTAARRMRTAAKLTEDLARQAPKVKPAPPVKPTVPTVRPPVTPPITPPVVPPVTPPITPPVVVPPVRPPTVAEPAIVPPAVPVAKPPVVPVEKALPKELEPLAREARKLEVLRKEFDKLSRLDESRRQDLIDKDAPYVIIQKSQLTADELSKQQDLARQIELLEREAKFGKKEITAKDYKERIEIKRQLRTRGIKFDVEVPTKELKSLLTKLPTPTITPPEPFKPAVVEPRKPVRVFEPEAVILAAKSISPKVKPSPEELTSLQNIVRPLFKGLATDDQRTIAHILSGQRKMTPRQLHTLERRLTAKRTMAIFTPTGRIKKHAMTISEAQTVIGVLKDLMRRRGRLILPKVRLEERIVGLLPAERVATAEKDAEIKEGIRVAKLPFEDTETLARLKGYDPYKITAQQQDELIRTLQGIQKNPIEADRIRQAYEGHKTFKDENITREYRRILKHEARIRQAKINKARRKIKIGRSWHTPLYEVTRVNIKDSIIDVRYALGNLQTSSGIPFHRKHYISISEQSNLKAQEMGESLALLTKGIEKEVTLGEQKRISNYFQAEYLKQPLPELTDVEMRVVKNVRDLMMKYKSFIKDYRYYQWLESKLEGEKGGLGRTDIPDVTQKTLEEGFKIWEREGEKGLDKWLAKQTFGVISKGYVPRAILGGTAKFPQYTVGRFTRKMLRPRQAQVDLSNIPLMLRVKKYLNNVLNLKYIEKPVASLDNDLNALRGGGHIPGDTTDKIQHWINVNKGYGREQNPLDKVLRVAQRMLHRAITVKPFLWFRNMFQREVTTPFRRPMITPSLRFTLFKNLSEADKDYFFLNVSQFEPMVKSYLFFLGKSRTKIPILSQFVGLAESVGKFYPVTDLWNRKAVYNKTLRYVKPYIERYAVDKKLEPLKKHTPFSLMKIYEQEYFLELLDKDPDKLIKWLAKWNSDNSQWLYKVSERSFAEMDKGYAFYNLFVWPKGIAQLTGNLLAKAMRGRTWAERRSGTMAFIGLVIASEVARRIIRKVVGRKRAGRYEGYDLIQSVLWSLGGATISSINQFIGDLSFVIWAYETGDRKTKKRARANFFKTIDRTNNLFLPFLQMSLQLAAALTDKQYISPFYNVMVKRAKYMRRTVLEKIQHGLFGKITRPPPSKKRVPF